MVNIFLWIYQFFISEFSTDIAGEDGEWLLSHKATWDLTVCKAGYLLHVLFLLVNVPWICLDWFQRAWANMPEVVNAFVFMHRSPTEFGKIPVLPVILISFREGSILSFISFSAYPDLLASPFVSELRKRERTGITSCPMRCLQNYASLINCNC